MAIGTSNLDKNSIIGFNYVIFYLLIFSIPFLTVSPWQKVFSVSVGYIYVAIVVLNFIYLLKVDGVKGLLKRFSKIPLFWLLVLFLVINFVSILVNMPNYGYTMDTLVEFVYRLFSVSVYFLVVLMLNKDNFSKVIKIYLIASSIAAAVGLYETIGYMLGLATGQPLTYVVPRLFGTATEPQVFGNFLLSCLPLTLGLMVYTRKYSSAVFLSTFILALAMIMTISVGAWAGMMGAVIFMFLFLRSMATKGIVASILTIILLTGVIWSINHLIEPDYYMGLTTAVEVKVLGNNEDYKGNEVANNYLDKSKLELSVKFNSRSFVERAWFRQAAWDIFKDHPLIGIGTGNYGSVYNKYRPAGTPVLNFKVKAHNQYLKILSENGIIGFGVFIAIISSMLFRSWKNYFISDPKQKNYIIGILACLIGIGVHGYSFGFLRHNYTWVMVGFLMALVSQVEDQGSIRWGSSS